MPMASTEKPKARLFDAVLPSVWFIKLRSLRKKPSRSLIKERPENEPVIPDSAPFLPKTVENCYRHSLVSSEMCVFTPLKNPLTITLADQSLGNPTPEKPFYKEFPVPIPGKRRSSMMSDATTATTATVSSIATNATSTSSIFSRCSYRSTIFSSLRNLCRLVGDDDHLTVKVSSPGSFRKSATPSMRAWFLAGCGSIPRNRTRHGSMDLEKESGLIELDANTGLECVEGRMGIEGSWPRKAESWSGAHPTTWSVELTSDEVVKNQVVVKKRETKSLILSKFVDVKSPSKAKPTLGHLFSKSSETDSPKKVFSETKELYEELRAEDPKLALPWRSPSFGSGDSTNFVAPSEMGPTNERVTFSVSDSEAVVPYSEEFDKGNISDSQSLLKAKVLAAERLREGSKSWREHRKLEKQKEEEAAKLLASLDEALDQHNLKRLIEEEEESEPGYDSRFGSPRFEMHNSPVFESFLESSAKAWGIDFPTLKIDDLKTSGSISDKSRELHCVTVQTAIEMDKGREQMQERERGRETTRGMRLNSSPAKARKSKRFMEKEIPKKRSPSRKASPKDTREERTKHPQREESMVDPELHDEFNNARRKFNEARKRSKQRRSKQVASVPSPPSIPEKQHGVVKERVAVVVESSYDPYNDFRESMIEMIVDQDIQETGDLEELLQCYLSLNEAEYHNVIVDVFTDVWHELFENNR